MILFHYIHHIIFDPLSWWGRFWADAFWSAVVVCAMFIGWMVYMGCVYVSYLWKRMQRG